MHGLVFEANGCFPATAKSKGLEIFADSYKNYVEASQEAMRELLKPDNTLWALLEECKKNVTLSVPPSRVGAAQKMQFKVLVHK